MPLWILLIPYAIFLLVFLLFSFVDMANTWRFRTSFFSATMLTLVYLSGSAILLYGSYIFLLQIDWMQTVGAGISFTLPTL